jgi:hypothetical protein
VTHWPSYNQSLVRQGEILFSYDFLDIWDNDLATLNENKKGKKYQYPDYFILISAISEYVFTFPIDKHRSTHQSNARKEYA